MKMRSRTALTAPFVSLAGTMFLVAPALAGREDVPNRPERNPIAAARRELRQNLRLEREAMHVTGRERRVSTSIANAAENALHNNHFSINSHSQNRFTAAGRSTFLNSSEKVRAVTRGLELDLSSDNRSIVLGDNLFESRSSYTIKLGDQEKTLSAGSQVSPAEFVALQQVLNDGKQDLILDLNGRGVDGNFSIDSITDGGAGIHAKSLVIPSNVEASGNLSRSSDFRLTGDLINNGNVYLTDKANGSSIAARDISNGDGATIHGRGDLAVAASRDFVNAGTISADGSLTISAGNSLDNSGTISGGTALTIESPSVQNSGLIETPGSVNINTPTPSSIYFDSTGGIVRAGGDINFRSSGFAEKVDTTLIGGQWTSDQLNLCSGDGALRVNVDDITGGVTINAGTAVINSAGAELIIDELVTNGDPLISSPGTIYLPETSTYGAPLSVISGRDIILQGGIFTSSITGDGGDIILIAGAQFEITGDVLEVTGMSASGGNISGTRSFSATSSVGNGGDILLAAFGTPGFFSTSGRISLGNESEFRTEGASGHSYGNVTLIAPTSISVGQIKVNGSGSTTPGDIYVSGSQPLIVGSLTIDTMSGALLSGSLTGSVGTGHSSVGSLSGGQISLSGDSLHATGITAITSVSVTANSSSVEGPVKTPLISINVVDTDGFAYFGDKMNQVGLFNLTGGGHAEISNNADLHIGSIGATQSVTMSSNQSIIVEADFATTGDLVFATNNLQNAHSVSANSIRAYSPSAMITIDGGTGGSFAATGAGQKIAVGAWIGGVTLAGTLSFSGETEVTSLTSSPITIAAEANVSGNSSITLNAANINLIGSLTANPVVFNYGARGGTIVNSQGNVLLTGPIIMNGSDLAIVASKDVLVNGSITINTSSETGDGGDVLIWAGAYITPQTPGQVSDSFTPFTVTRDPGDRLRGNVILSGVDINSSSLNGAGGDVTVIASFGTIELGDINASGTATGGNIKLYGQSGVAAGNIMSTGTTGGAIEVATSPVLLSSLLVYNGSVTGTVSYGYSLSQSDVSLGAINSGNGSIYVRANDLTIGGPSTANQMTLLSSATVNLTALNGISLRQDESGNGGALYLDARNILFNTSADNPFKISADGQGDGNGGSVRIFQSDNRTHMYVGNGGKTIAGSQFLEISAKSGDGIGGSGGLIHLTTAGDLTVNSESMNASAIGSGVSTGATYMLSAGFSGLNATDGKLLVIGDLIADGINGGAPGEIELRSGSDQDFILNAGNKTIKSGVTGILSASGPLGRITIITKGSISVKQQAALQASGIALITGYDSTQRTSITAKNVVLTAEGLSLDVGSPKAGTKLKVNTSNLYLEGAIRSIENVGTNALYVYGSLNGGDFSLTSQSSVSIRELHSADGGISVTTTTGGITLLNNFDNGAITAPGNIKLHAQDELTGSIRLEEKTKIYNLPKGGDITLAVGKIIKGKHTEAPPNVNAVGIKGGKVFFEPGPGVVDAIGMTSSVNAIKHTVRISSSAGQKITFEGGNLILATNEATPVFTALSQPQQTREAGYSAKISTDTLLTSGDTALRFASPTSIKSAADSPGADRLSNSNRLVQENLIPKQSSAVPSDLLPNHFTALDINPITAQAPTKNTTYGITDAYIWSDRELGLGKHRMLKSNSSVENEVGTNSIADNSHAAINAKTQPEKARLRKGTMLFCPSRDTQLETPLGVIDISADAIVFVSLDETRLAVYDLHDEHKGAVKVSVGTESSSLHPGRFLLVTDKFNHGFEALNPMEAVGYKSLNTHHHGNKIKAISAEFSTISLLNSVIPLRELLASSHVGAKQLSAKLVKTTAVLMHLGNSEEFRNYSTPSFVANNNRN